MFTETETVTHSVKMFCHLCTVTAPTDTDTETGTETDTDSGDESEKLPIRYQTVKQMKTAFIDRMVFVQHR